jgi:hypothetical protein
MPGSRKHTPIKGLNPQDRRAIIPEGPEEVWDNKVGAMNEPEAELGKLNMLGVVEGGDTGLC